VDFESYQHREKYKCSAVAFLFVGIKEKKMKAKNGEIYH
jgi:hypothetical protein